MSSQVTLEQLKQQVAQLPLQEQIKLIVDISERLSAMPLVVLTKERDWEWARIEQSAQVDAWIAKCDEVAELWEGEFDSATDLRRIRDEET
ncbi:MAG: hypothetical protein HY731_05850 [Candidatus Tectomicrobia bacterium]|nr:hypothetical protein [Candidatus Tectomicrobia bacterium]